MNELEHRILKDVGEYEDNNSLSENTANHSYNDILKNSDLDRSLSDSVRYLDQQRMLMEQENSMMALKMSEYEKTLAERDFSIESLHTDMINYQNNNYILSNQYKSLIESTKSINSIGMRLNTCLNDISERLNRLEDTLVNVTKRHKEVLTNNNTFQEKVIHVSSSIDGLFNQVNIEREKAKEELDNLKNKYSLECNIYKTTLEESYNEIENVKSENAILVEKLNAINITLNDEKESVLNKNKYFEKAIEEKTNQNLLLMNEIKVVTSKYDEILAENQSLKDELATIKISLDNNEKQLDLKLKIIDDQAELFVNLKKSEELNDMLKKDNLTLRERNEYLEKIKTELMDDISNNIVYQNTIEEENETKFKDICKNYDNTLKIYEEKILQLTEKIELQKTNEFTIQNEIINLKQEVQMSNNTITKLQEELKLNLSLIPELQNKIDNLNDDLTINYKKLQDCNTEFATERSKLEKEKIKLENKSKEQHLKLTETTANYIKYKSKVMPLYSEVLRLRQKCVLFEQKKSFEHHPTENMEINGKKGYEDGDLSNGEDVSTKNIVYASHNMNKTSSNCSSKRNCSIYVDNTNLKKYKISNDMNICQDKLKPTFIQTNDSRKPNSPVPITVPSPTRES